MNNFYAAAAAAAVSNPMRSVRTAGRVLLVDGDSLAYTCSGSDDCSAGQARINVNERVRKAMHACGADRVDVLLTASGSHKGHRYAIARSKPYQGQRQSGRRPKNWQFLRDLLTTGGFQFPVSISSDLEADDLFAHRSAELGAESCVHHSPDKDMRQVPGYHLDWTAFTLHHHDVRCFRSEAVGKTYGHAWFWMQMLHGDTADNIPGLPFYIEGTYPSGPNKGQPKRVLCGPKSTAVKGLEHITDDTAAYHYVLNRYRTCYGERAVLELLEQACLLWMRRTASVLDCTLPRGPLCGVLALDDAWAQEEIINRTKVVQMQDMG